MYTPPGYDPDAVPYDVMLQLDGETYTNLIDVPGILDELIDSEQLPPTVALLVDNIDHETRMREYGCSSEFVSFLADELLPWASDHYNIMREASRTVLSGSSMGGLAACFAGLMRPDAFGSVLSQSGSFWWRPEGDPEHEWLARQYVTSDMAPVSFYVEVGRWEQDATPDNGPTQVVVNRHMRDILRARGYALHYSEFDHGHSWEAWKGTLPRGLLALRGARPVEPDEVDR